jgi:hypothetical protein
MNTAFFIDELTQVFPGKDLTAAQHVAYREKLGRFDDQQRQSIYDWILEHCKFFPKIADVYEAATMLGFLVERDEFKPHVWTPTDCRFCGGSGLMAAMYEQEYERSDAGATQILKLVHVGPYHLSAERYSQQVNEIRSAFRCACPAGDAETLQKGIQRWSDQRPMVLKRPWG